MPTFTTPGPIAAIVQVAGARVRVTATDRADTVVLVEPVDATNRRDVKVAERTRVAFDGGRLKVKTTDSGTKEGSVAITIDLPTGSSLTAYTAHSSVHVHGLVGDVELHAAKGQFHLDRITALQANIATGEVEIGHVAGGATIDGSVVALRIGEVTGAVKLSNAGGQTWIGQASAEVDLSSANGGLDIDRAEGSVTARTANGAIRIGRLVRGRAELSNSSGSIEVGVGDGAAVRVDADSTRGMVRNSVAAQAAADPAEELVTVHARTRHGDVVIHRAAS